MNFKVIESSKYTSKNGQHNERHRIKTFEDKQIYLKINGKLYRKKQEKQSACLHSNDKSFKASLNAFAAEIQKRHPGVEVCSPMCYEQGDEFNIFPYIGKWGFLINDLGELYEDDIISKHTMQGDFAIAFNSYSIVGGQKAYLDLNVYQGRCKPAVETIDFDSFENPM